MEQALRSDRVQCQASDPGKKTGHCALRNTKKELFPDDLKHSYPTGGRIPKRIVLQFGLPTFSIRISPNSTTTVNVVDLSIFEFFSSSGAPLVGRPLGNPGLRGSGFFCSVVPDSRDRFQDLGEYCGSSFRVAGNQHGSFRGQGHDGIFELKFPSSWTLHPGGDHHECPCNDGHDDHGKEFLADAVGSLAMKLFDLEGDFFTSVVVFNRPAPEIKPDDFLLFEAALIEHVCEEHRNLPIGAY